MLGIQPSFREENHSGSEHSILLPYYQQPVDANASEHEQEQQRVQAIQAYFKDVYDTEQKLADAETHANEVMKKYNFDKRKYSQDPEYQKYHKILGDIIQGPEWNNDYNIKRYQYYYALDPNSAETKQALRQLNGVAKENAAKKAEDDWEKNKWKYIAIGAAILAATIAIPVAGAAIGEAAGTALIGTVLGEAAADTTITVGAFDTGITAATAATETGGFLGMVGGNAAAGAAASAASGGSKKEIQQGAALGAIGGVIGSGAGFIGKTAAEALDVGGYLSSNVYANAIQRGAVAAGIGGGLGSAFGAAAGASGIVPNLSAKEGAKKGALWGGLNGLFYGPKYLFRGGRNEANVSVNANDSMTKSDYVNWVDYGQDFDGNLMVLPDMNNLLTDDLSTISPNMNDFLRDDLSTLSPASPLFGDVSLNNSGLNNNLLNNYFFRDNLDESFLRPRQLFSADTPSETVVGNNFDVPPTPIPMEDLTDADLEYEIDDALQNEIEVANEREMQAMAVRMGDIDGVGPVTYKQMGFLIEEDFGQNQFDESSMNYLRSSVRLGAERNVGKRAAILKEDENRYGIERLRFLNNLNRNMQFGSERNVGRREAILANDQNRYGMERARNALLNNNNRRPNFVKKLTLESLGKNRNEVIRTRTQAKFKKPVRRPNFVKTVKLRRLGDRNNERRPPSDVTNWFNSNT